MQILLQERSHPSEPLVLKRVNQFVEKKPTVAPSIGADEHAIPQRESGGAIGYELSRICGSTERRMLWHGHADDTQQPDPLRMRDTDRHGVGSLGGREGVAITRVRCIALFSRGILQVHIRQALAAAG